MNDTKRLHYLYEIPVFYAALLLLNWYLCPEYPAFFEVEVHPFWLGILLFAQRYGFSASVLAGLTSAALYIGICWFHIDAYILEDWDFYLLPGCFVIVAGFVGAGAHRLHERVILLLRERDILIANEAPLKEEIATLTQIDQGLEKKVVSQMSTLVTLYEGARQLESTDLAKLTPAIVRFFAKVLQAEAVSMHLKMGEEWRLSHAQGFKPEQPALQRVEAGKGLIGLCGECGKILSVRDFLDTDVSPEELGDAVLAGPLRRGQGGPVIGIFSIQRIPFFHLNGVTMNLMGFLLDWASRSIGQAYAVQELKKTAVVDPAFDVYSAAYFHKRAGLEFVRSRTYYLPLSVLVVRSETPRPLFRDGHEAVMRAVAALLKATLRDIDVVAVSDREGLDFVALLVTCGGEQAASVCSRVSANFDKLGLIIGGERVKLRLGVASYTPQVTDFTTILNAASKALGSSPDEEVQNVGLAP